MKLIPTIVAGCVLATLAAIASLVSGHGILNAVGAYVVFGMIGTLLAALISWTRSSLSALPQGRRPIEAAPDSRGRALCEASER